jgi:DNA-binding CsgD family transcriptional regulator
MTMVNLTQIRPAVDVVSSQSEAIRRICDLIVRHGEVLAGYAHPQLAEVYCGYFKRIGLPALRRGASIRTIYTDSVYSDAAGIGFIRDTIRAGCQARTVSYLPATHYAASVIIGERFAVLPACAGDSGCRWSFHCGDDEVAALRDYLEGLWGAAAPVEADPPASSSLSPLERRILHQLRLGAKDESGARMLGISVRTYRRHVTALCVRLGASSRFEAGVNAAHAGLVRPGY